MMEIADFGLRTDFARVATTVSAKAGSAWG